ncbi:MAG: hypothetical protein L6R40_007841 [Gallowayella cf. fulva]|nr:MAG: hypothetical protein L6R40_007841 [Xanthomendoza cf. fulva]
MSTLTSHRVLSFDAYGTLIDWETGIYTSFLSTLPSTTPNPSKRDILIHFHSLESSHQTSHPNLPYSHLLSKIHPLLTSKLNLPTPTDEASRRFGESVGDWPAFPDTLDALKRLQKHFKLVILSNTDRESFSATNAKQLPGIDFDAVLTAQHIGSYKPDKRTFEYMLDYVRREWGVERDQVLQTAQSQFHDHHPAREMGIRTVWIVRPGALMGGVGDKGEDICDWKFDTLGDMADAVERTNHEDDE